MSQISQFVTVPINAFSDGVKERWPERGLKVEDPESYLTKLATKWMKDRGLYKEGKLLP